MPRARMGPPQPAAQGAPATRKAPMAAPPCEARTVALPPSVRMAEPRIGHQLTAVPFMAVRFTAAPFTGRGSRHPIMVPLSQALLLAPSSLPQRRHPHRHQPCAGTGRLQPTTRDIGITAANNAGEQEREYRPVLPPSCRAKARHPCLSACDSAPSSSGIGISRVRPPPAPHARALAAASTIVSTPSSRSPLAAA